MEAISILFIFGIIFGFVTAKVADSKGYDYLTWWFVGAFLGILGLICIACMPKKSETEESS